MRDHSQSTVPQLYGILEKALYTVFVEHACDLQTKIENRDIFHVLSDPNCVIKKGPFHGARHGNTERQRNYYAAHNAAKESKEGGVQIHVGQIPE